MTELVYREISAQKAVSGDSFPQGNIDFNFSCNSPSSWIPAKSYFRIEMTVSGLGGVNQPSQVEQLAFADSAAGCLFDNVYARQGGQDISSCVNYVAQTAALKARLQKTGAWLNSIGKSAYMLESNFQKRVSQVSTFAVNSGADPKYDDTQRIAVGTGAALLTATVSSAAGDGVILGVGTNFNKAVVGDKLVIKGIQYTIMVITSATLVNVYPFPTAIAVAENLTDAFILKVVPDLASHHNTIYTLFQPPIGLFDYSEPMPSGDVRISLNPNANYKLACVESAQGTYAAPIVAGTAATSNFNVVIGDIKLYVATIKTVVPSGISTMYLMESLCQSKPCSSGQQSFQFTIPSSTKAISIFVQSSKAGVNPLVPPSSFKCIPDAVAVAGTERNLKSLQLTYGGVTKPQTRWASSYTTTVNEMAQRYNDSLSESGLLMSSGGSESLKEWLERGGYYHYSFLRDESDRSTELQLSTDYLALELNANVFVVAWYSRSIEITTSAGQTTSVRTLSV